MDKKGRASDRGRPGALLAGALLCLCLLTLPAAAQQRRRSRCW